MDWNENQSVRLSQACVVIFAVLLLFVIFGVSIFTGRKKTERTK